MFIKRKSLTSLVPISTGSVTYDTLKNFLNVISKAVRYILMWINTDSKVEEWINLR
ncbi:MAG: hypothetical protein AEth_01494 [Candidatus Argoarchaeum ethanivorans]|uniref:Uncharacterized protein n=1 Tax=Candidatus Argoarchaeum ethanivorans TaxID=2608793 RepID=A0A8B3S153_9EURY|nr:MAG: hypothetical protein AEth_01494 [Candidatus Argoarchaeum ethanivorans]